MKRLAVLGLVAGAVLAAVFLAKKNQSTQSPQEREARQAEKRSAMFQKMQAGMEAMPGHARRLSTSDDVQEHRSHTGELGAYS